MEPAFKKELTLEQFNEYQELRNQAMKDFTDFPMEVPDSLLASVPDFKREMVKKQAKLDLISMEMEKAKERIKRLNSPFKDKEIASLKVNYRNFLRQLIDVRTKLGVEERNTEQLFLRDKLEAEIKLMEEDLNLFGLMEEDLNLFGLKKEEIKKELY